MKAQTGTIKNQLGTIKNIEYQHGTMKNITVIHGGPPLVQKLYCHSQRALTDLLWSKNLTVIHRWDSTDLLWSKKYYVIHGGLK